MVWKFFVPKWPWKGKNEKFHLVHSSIPETSLQRLISIMTIPPMKNHYPQWIQIPQILIYSAFVSIGALLPGVNLTLKISKEIKMLPWMV